MQICIFLFFTLSPSSVKMVCRFKKNWCLLMESFSSAAQQCVRRIRIEKILLYLCQSWHFFLTNFLFRLLGKGETYQSCLVQPQRICGWCSDCWWVTYPATWPGWSACQTHYVRYKSIRCKVPATPPLSYQNYCSAQWWRWHHPFSWLWCFGGEIGTTSMDLEWAMAAVDGYSMRIYFIASRASRRAYWWN